MIYVFMSSGIDILQTMISFIKSKHSKNYSLRKWINVRKSFVSLVNKSLKSK